MNLIDIEKRYATELVEFFCKEYQKMYKNRLVLIGFIEKQIQSIRVNSGVKIKKTSEIKARNIQKLEKGFTARSN